MIRPSFFRHYTFLDTATQAYLAGVGTLILVFHRDRVPGWPWLVLAHALVGLLVHGVVQTHARSVRPPRWLSFLRHFYPMILYTGFYRETGVVNQMFVTGYWDAGFIRLERWLFGLQPSLALMEWWPHRVVAEVLYASYFSYYVMIVGVGLALYCQNRAHFSRYLSVVSWVFYLCYLLYIVLPVVGPRLFTTEDLGGAALPLELRPVPFPVEAPPAVQRALFFQIMALIYEWFEAEGAAFPSSHVAVAVATVCFSRRYLPRLWRVHLIVVGLLCVATVYCRYHYVVDVVAGLCTAALLVPLGNRLYDRFGQEHPPHPPFGHPLPTGEGCLPAATAAAQAGGEGASVHGKP